MPGKYMKIKFSEEKIKAVLRGGEYDGKIVYLPKPFPVLKHIVEWGSNPGDRVEGASYKLVSTGPPLQYEIVDSN
jgi:hypothetical protein